MCEPRILMVCRQMVRKNKPVEFVGEAHIDWIQKFGGVVILLPRTALTRRQLEHYYPLHGLLLVEAEDCEPEFFKPFEKNGIDLESDEWERIKEVHKKDTNYDIEKDIIEWTLLKHALETEAPVLGICRGCQLINLAYGGTLYEDVETQVEGSVKHLDHSAPDSLRHGLNIEATSPLGEFYKTQKNPQGQINIAVNSYHHQAVRSLGDSLKVMARSPDGVIEAFYDASNYAPSKGKFCIGLQFHPERLGEDAHDGSGLKLFEAFVESARQYCLK